ncbi:MAG: hypothetical protein LBC72_05340 [Spirochaetaceae bacterium]|jgi:hypothetical protein|nr:hypothetical protein [Spirochaetaceae bacterium]
MKSLAGLFKPHEDEAVFVKTTAAPVDPSLKAALNRKGNVLFNSGDVEGARRIFVTTGYSDGLTRVGDYYKSKGRFIDALGMYCMAPNEKKRTEVSMELALFIKGLLKEGA